jgi:hypothetical protein
MEFCKGSFTSLTLSLRLNYVIKYSF